MKKSIISLSIAGFVLSAGIAYADSMFHQTQSPIYTDSIGREHFLSRGGYTYTHNVGTGEVDADVINETAKTWAKEDKTNDIIYKKNEATEGKFVPAANLGGGDGYAYEKGEDGYIYGQAIGGEQGVNESKTIYTDGIGRLHFFGKKNRIHE